MAYTEKIDKRAGFGAFLQKTLIELNLSKEELSQSMAKDIPEFGIVVKERRKRQEVKNAAGYSHYEGKVTAPKFETIIRLAKAFSVPVDFFLNYKDYAFLDANEIKKFPFGLLPENYAKYHFGKKLREIRQNKNMSMDKFEKVSGMRKPSLQQYERYKNAPGETLIDSFVKYLEVPASVFYPEMETLKEQLNMSKKNKVSGDRVDLSIRFVSEGDILLDDASVITITLPAGMDRKRAIEEAMRQLQAMKLCDTENR